jgi:RNA polymerase sigma factor (sigma-70 family)
MLTKRFGIEFIEVAEDIASEAFLSALQIWPYKGVPENPSAWLYLVAKNKARNYLTRKNIFDGKISSEIKSTSLHEELDLNFGQTDIRDSQLEMLFAICHPILPVESQVGLALRFLCGFGIEEIANAFLSNKETINKRLFRAKEKLREQNVRIGFPDDTDMLSRLDAVLTTLYLLFSEGYYSESHHSILREELCFEAIRLATLLTENPKTNVPRVNALLALMCFHASRFHARKNKDDKMVLYDEQNEELWDKELIAKGAFFLKQSSTGKDLSPYHLEASIAYWHTLKADTPLKWESILSLYNHLLMLQYSPIAALNRTYALSKVKGKREAIQDAEKLQLTDNHFYFALLGELYLEDNNSKAIHNFEKALQLAKTNSEKETIQRKLDSLTEKGARKPLPDSKPKP